MKANFKAALILMILIVLVSGCGRRADSPQALATPTPSPAGSTNETVPTTLPVLDALFADEAFTKGLKSKLQLTDDQISALRRISRAAVAKLRQSNAEN